MTQTVTPEPTCTHGRMEYSTWNGYDVYSCPINLCKAILVPVVVPEPRTEPDPIKVPEEADIASQGEPAIDPSDVWTQLVLDDEYLKLEALVTAKALARLVDANQEIRISQRSLTDAVDRPDLDGMRSKFVRIGLKYLIDRGWVQHLNPGAARQERRHLRLAIPMNRWPF